MYLDVRIRSHIGRSTADRLGKRRSQQLTHVVGQEIITVVRIGVASVRKTSFVCRVFPTDGTLYPEKHITIAYIHRYLRQVIDIRLGEILQFLRTTVTEHA